jgi:hypothetical protein
MTNANVLASCKPQAAVFDTALKNSAKMEIMTDTEIRRLRRFLRQYRSVRYHGKAGDLKHNRRKGQTFMDCIGVPC